jgi:alcohol dehydrogenase class IV
LYDPKTRAQAVFVHPDQILSAPRELVVSATLNTFSLAIEGLVSRSGDPMSDASLMHVVRLCLQRLTDPALTTDPAARADLVVAAIMCGQGTDHTAAGITTVLGHAIGARHGVENGVLNAIVLAHALRFNGTAAESGLQKVAAALGLAPAGGEALVAAVIDRVNALFAGLGVAQRLRDVGVPRELLSDVAQAAMGDWFLSGNPRRVQSASELLQVLQDSW